MHAAATRRRPGARPGRSRCSPLATDGGDSTWTTRSTAPMSMPSSRLEVATTAGSRPVFSSSSICGPLLLADRPVVGPGQHRRGAPADAPAWAIIWAGVPGARPAARAGAAPLARSARRSRSAGRSAARPAGGSWRTRWSSGARSIRSRPAPRRAARSRLAAAAGRVRPSARSGRRWRRRPSVGHVLRPGTTTSTVDCLSTAAAPP